MLGRAIDYLRQEWIDAPIERAERSLRRGAIMGGAALFVALLMLIGILFLALGAMLSLAGQMPPWQAGLIVGGALVGLALIALLLLRWRHDWSRGSAQGASWRAFRRGETRSMDDDDAACTGQSGYRHGPEAVPPRDGVDDRMDQASQLGEALGNQVRRRGSPPSDIMLAALAAGVALGASSALRRRDRRRDRGGRRYPD